MLVPINLFVMPCVSNPPFRFVWGKQEERGAMLFEVPERSLATD